MILPDNVEVRISMADMPRCPGMVVYEIIADTPIKVAREVKRIVDRIDQFGGVAEFRNPVPFGGAFISRGYTIEIKEPC